MEAGKAGSAAWTLILTSQDQLLEGSRRLDSLVNSSRHLDGCAGGQH